jgi:UPF0755 protein
VTDGRDTSWYERGRQRHHHLTADHGHQVLRDQSDEWEQTEGRGYPQQRPSGARGYPAPGPDGPPPNGYDQYPAYGPSNGYPGPGYDPNAYDADGYDSNGFDAYGYDRYGYNAEGFDANGQHVSAAQGYGQPPYPNSGYPDRGYADQGYAQPGYPDPAQDGRFGQTGSSYPGYYDERGYDPNYRDPNFTDPNFTDPGYGVPGYPEPGYGQPRYGQPGHDGQAYGDQAGDRGYRDQGHRDQGHRDQGYGDQGYGDQGYGDPRYGDPRYGDPRYGDPRYGDPRYGQPSYPAPAYPDNPYGPPGPPDDRYRTAGYPNPPDGGRYEPPQYFPEADGNDPTDGFGGHGFVPANEPEVTTDGRGMRGVDDSGRRGGRGGNNDFPPIPVGPEPKRRRGRTPLVLAIVVILLAVVGVGAYWGIGQIRHRFATPDYSGSGTGVAKIKVSNGDTASAIAQTLYTGHVVKSAKAFVKAADADPRSKDIQPGFYQLHQHMSAASALAALEARNTDGTPTNALVYKVTIPEGYISVDIYVLLSQKTGIPVAQFVAAAKNPTTLGVNKSWYTDKRDDHRSTVTANEPGFKYPAMIEGFLFPATYTFQPDETAQQMLADMVKKFNDVIAQIGFTDAARNVLRIPPIEALIAASVAQKEASTASDMTGVTKVLYNRVFKGLANGTLGVDSETNYFLRMTGHDSKTSNQLKNSELHSKSDPYNTHDVTGFPPGAISNPGEDALKAAISPNPSLAGYGYFQTIGTNPKVVFSKTYTEFCTLNHSC